MTYNRPRCSKSLSSDKKKEILKEYNAFYAEQVIINGFQKLNQKIPREIFSTTLDEIGTILLDKADDLARNDKDTILFLENNPLPPELQELLPNSFRTFCLLLNAMKQWISAEQSATDRYLLGGTARAQLRKATTKCIVTDETIIGDGELHHPVRDGRPPILLSKKGHALLEGQVKKGDAINKSEMGEFSRQTEENLGKIMKEIKQKGHNSWIQLRNGVMDFLELEVKFSTQNVKNTSRVFAKKVHENTGLSYKQILEWLDNNKLGFSV